MLRKSQAMHDVIAERFRQIEAEGWTHDHDDKHDSGEMADAAAVYAATAEIQLIKPREGSVHGNKLWPWWDQADVSGGRGDCPVWGWTRAWFKPRDRRRNLVRAAALLIAEIERLDRAALTSPPAGEDTQAGQGEAAPLAAVGEG